MALRIGGVLGIQAVLADVQVQGREFRGTQMVHGLHDLRGGTRGGRGGAVGESELLGAVTCARVDSFGYLAEVARGVSSLHLYLKLVQACQQELVDCPRVVGVQG